MSSKLKGEFQCIDFLLQIEHVYDVCVQCMQGMFFRMTSQESKQAPVLLLKVKGLLLM
jgi:hypothetical protein